MFLFAGLTPLRELPKHATTLAFAARHKIAGDREHKIVVNPNFSDNPHFALTLEQLAYHKYSLPKTVRKVEIGGHRSLFEAIVIDVNWLLPYFTTEQKRR